MSHRILHTHSCDTPKCIVTLDDCNCTMQGGVWYCELHRARKILRCTKCQAEMMPGSLNGQCQTCNKVVDDAVNHPRHYGGADNPYETIKVIRAWELGFTLGNTVKYISRAGRKGSGKMIEDLKKAAWYLAEEIAFLERGCK